MPTRERIAKNELLFREVNERIREVGRFADARTRFDFFCECADFECTERMTVPLGEYVAVREQVGQFLVLPGHEVRTLERVIRQLESYSVIEKPWLVEGTE